MCELSAILHTGNELFPLELILRLSEEISTFEENLKI